MNNVMRKILAICLVASLGVAGFGCSSNTTKDESSTVVGTVSLDDPALKQELEFSFPNSGVDASEKSEDATEAKDDSGSDNSSAEQTTELVTEYVEVTDASGQKATDASGAVQTDVVEKPVNPSSGTESTPEGGSKYEPEMDICKAYFLDMTKQGDFKFDGEFLVFEFKIKEDTPDGVYPITISSTDICNWDVVTLKPVILNGEIVVGDAEPTKTDKPNGEDFTLDVDSVKGNPGDTVQVKITADQNPGFCGFVILVQYDKAAFEITYAEGGKDYNSSVNLVE